MSKRTFWKSFSLFTRQEIDDMLLAFNEGVDEDMQYDEEDIAEVNDNDYFNDDFGKRGNLAYSSLKNTPCIVSGTLGLWDGKHKVIPKTFPKIEDAIYACLDECEGEIYEDENGDLHIVAYHHDGTNTFAIKHLDGQPLRLSNEI